MEAGGDEDGAPSQEALLTTATQNLTISDVNSGNLPKALNIQTTMDMFKKVYKERGPDDLEVQAPYLAALGDFYFNKARSEPQDWTHFVKAHALYSSAAVRVKANQDYLHKSYQVEEMYFGGKHYISESERDEMTRKHKDKLEAIRTRLRKQEVNQMTELIDRINVDDLSCDQNKEIMREFSKLSQYSSLFCTEAMKELAADIIASSIDIIGEPPCSFVTAALGSLARGEATPYSDLEYLFLIEDTNYTDYFERLAVTSYFLITNLQETKLRYMNIAELAEPEWFEDQAMNGFKIDGLMKIAGNIPTGNGLIENRNKFIKTPTELFCKYEKEWRKPTSGDIAGMCDMLASLTLIYAHKDGQKLLELFQSKLSSLPPNIDHQAAASERINQDAKKYNFIPRSIIGDSKMLAVKYDIYRYPTIILYDLKILYNIKANNPWEVMNELSSHYNLSETLRDALEFLLAVALYTRLASYLQYNSQKEQMTVLLGTPEVSSGNASRFFFPRKLFHLMGAYLIPVKSICGKMADSTVAFQEIVVCDEVLSKSITHFYCLEWEQCLGVFARDIAGNSDPGVLESRLTSCYDLQAAVDGIWMIATAGNFSGQYSLALKYYQKALNMKLSIYEPDATGVHPDICVCYHNIGLVYLNQGDYKLALESCQKALDMEFSMYGTEEAHPSIANSYNNIGDIHRALGNYGLALEHHQKSLEMKVSIYGTDVAHPDIFASYNNIAIINTNQGNYELALQNHRRSLIMRLSFYGVDAAHPDIADCCNNIGEVYRILGNFDLALRNYQMSLDMCLRIYGAESSHPDISTCYNNIGLVYLQQIKYDLALENLQKSLCMKLAVHGANAAHPDIANIYNNIGGVYSAQDKYDLALENYQKSLSTTLAIHGTDFLHPTIAANYCNIGIVHSQQDDYSSALENFQKSLSIYETIYDTAQLDVAAVYHNIGEVYNSQSKYDLAIQSYQKSLDMRLSVYGLETPHPAIARCYSEIALAHIHQHNYDLALENYQKALDVDLSLYGADVSHPSIATIYDSIGLLHRALGNCELAVENHQKALQVKLSIRGPDAVDPDVAKSYSNIGEAHQAQNNYELALENHQKSLDMKLSYYGVGVAHPDIYKSYSHIGSILKEKGNYELAVENYQKSLDMAVTIYGSEVPHPAILVCYKNIDEVHKIQNANQAAED